MNAEKRRAWTAGLLVGLCCLLVIGLCIGSAFAATTPNSAVLPQTPNRGIVQVLQGTDSAGTYKTLYTGGSNGSMCFGMWMNTNDGTATHLVTVQLVNSAVKYGGTAITTVLSAGFASGVPAQAIMTPAVWPGLLSDVVGNEYIFLVSGDTIQATFATALTSSTVINLQVSCVDY